MKRTTIVLILIFLSSNYIYSQGKKDNFKGVGKNANSLNILGVTPVLGLSYERLILGKLSLEVGAGINSAGGGI